MTLKCNVCGSLTIRPDKRGIFKCENGHTVITQEDELNEYDGSYGALRKLSRQQKVYKKQENVQRKVLVYHQHILRVLVRLCIDEYFFPPQVELYLRNLWSLFLIRNYSALYSSVLSRALIRENFDLASTISLFIVVIYEFSIPISETTIMNLVYSLMESSNILGLFDEMSLPATLKDSMTVLDFALCLKKVTIYNHLLLGKPMAIVKAVQLTSTWNMFVESNIPIYPKSVKFLNKLDFDHLFWFLLLYFPKKFSSELLFWSRNIYHMSHSLNTRYINFYPRYCNHFLHHSVQFLSTTLKIGFINKYLEQ